MHTSFSLSDLIYLMARLRKPDTGCPWDLQQNYRSITPSTIEEVYEVVDAIEREDYAHLKEELGDLLFQVVFYAQLASEEGRFDFHSVVDAIAAKLLRRHPHVFPDGTLSSERGSDEVLSDEAIKANWEAIKQSERDDKGETGIFDDIPRALPGFTRAVKLQKRAAKFGFDWVRTEDVIDKIAEECAELKHALNAADEDQIEDELSDVMFSCVNLVRHLGRDPEALIRRGNTKFERRITSVDRQLREATGGKSGLDSALGHSAEDLSVLWENSKCEP